MVISTSPLVKTYTLKEFWNLPDPKDRSKLELIKGVLYMTPPPDYPHNRVVAKLDRILRVEIGRCGYRGEVYVPRAALWIDDNTYLEPDLMYISAELEAEMASGHWNRADIVVLFDMETPSSPADRSAGLKVDVLPAREKSGAKLNRLKKGIRTF